LQHYQSSAACLLELVYGATQRDGIHNRLSGAYRVQSGTRATFPGHRSHLLTPIGVEPGALTPNGQKANS
jgi:hypothetical protein